MQVSEVIGDRYELLDVIGRGGMATIYRAYDRHLHRTVAVKMLRDTFNADPKSVARFEREAMTASAVRYPNIVQVLAFGQSSGHYYLVMEYVKGLDLRKYLNREGILSNERAIEIAHDVALGLGMAHRRGIVHRDVKPHNILLGDDGSVKLTDFGIASVYTSLADEHLTAGSGASTSGTPIGTVEYCAPEQVRGEIVHPQADVYALGVVMYEMVTGQTPFAAARSGSMAVAVKHMLDMPEPPRRFNPNMWPAFERLVLRCLEKDPPQRFANGDVLAYALEEIARVQGSPASVPPSARPGQNGHSAAAGARGDIAERETELLPPRKPTIADLQTERLPPDHSLIADQKTRRLPP